MKTVSINNYIELYEGMPTDKKSAFLQYILFKELYFDEPVKNWLRKTLKSERDDLPRAMMTEALAAHVDEAEVRDDLEGVLKELPRDSLTYKAVKEILITSLADDTEAVRTWGAGLIRAHEKINPASKRKLSDFLSRHLKDETLPPRLRWNAALGLSRLGTRAAIRNLIAFGKSLMQIISVSGQNIETDIRIFLAEKVAYSLGSAHEKLSGYSRERDESLELLKEMSEQIGDDSDKSDPISHAIRRIEDHPLPSHPLWVRLAQGIQEFLSAPRLISAMATASLLLGLSIFGRLYNPSELPIFADILLIGNPSIRARAPEPSSKGPAPEKREFVLKHGDALGSGDFFRIKVSIDRNAYVYVLLCDSSGKISELFSERLEGGQTLLLPSEYEPFELDRHAGTETVFVLTSKEAIDKFDEKLKEMKKSRNRGD